jgi:zinc protease
VPVVLMCYLFDGGYAADQGRKLGTSRFAMGMLDEGAGELGALAFGDRAETLGANLGASASLDGGTAYLSALKAKLDPSVALFAQMLRQPRFDQDEIDRVKASWIAGIKQEKARPQSAAMRVLPPLLYGEGHPYAIPFTGSGTEASIASLTRDDLLAFHRDWLQPEKARIVIVGDTTLGKMLPELEKRFGDWRSPANAPALPSVPAVAAPKAPRVYLVNQPGAIQSNIYVAQVVPPTGDDATIDFDFANGVLGGEFSARLNMNLREDKHWAYGAYSGATNTLGQRPWIASAAVQADKTVESIGELKREIAEFASGTRPPTEAEVAKIRASNTRSLPGAYETGSAVLSQVAADLRYGRPADYIVRYKARNEAMTPEVAAQAARRIDPAALTWVVVGDLAKIEQPVRALGLGEVKVVDADGQPVAK